MKIIYAATARCRCGAGLAYEPGANAWRCSKLLLNQVPVNEILAEWIHSLGSNQDSTPKEVKHDAYPFIWFEVKSENQPSANGQTTRPS